ncbi:hypothetical protein P175DRAFT_0296297 [Aspergillus ochraceoroseus IBT 24754]|uniref:Uncharacterized protein n=1 Tax=Aspergillus ochraceoroseus IBT 24754 TaxID=1392256 RepID=A0A2T5LSN4_9EURO|nr:uncharacterized protein P175DRAFT_0296297 [Aspergillus ochraceoroseus IBT 24754]PTU19293.1 hypothetical protein P175DRAFT_0296297 [Aspergillus ochraceoroseus IBT 24754]
MGRICDIYIRYDTLLFHYFACLLSKNILSSCVRYAHLWWAIVLLGLGFENIQLKIIWGGEGDHLFMFLQRILQ